MYDVLSRSRISVNRHIDVAEGYANNMRLFETTGVGALLLTEAAPNLGDFFQPGREVVAYEGEDDLVEKIEHYLRNDDERLKIAAAGQQRTLNEHTYRRRIAELAAMLETRLERRR
jgi:spore maturation protein CgeB